MVAQHFHDVTVEEAVLDILKEAGLIRWQQQILFGLQIRKVQHFALHQDKEFKEMGMIPDEIKRLRASVQIRRNSSSSKTVIVKNENDSAQITIDPNKTDITKEQIKLMEKIGEGTFAVVKRALWYHPDGRKIDVAVKILRDISPLVMEDLKVEAGHLLNLQHPHLIRLYGVVQHPAMMVFELCEGGSLLERLRDSNKPVLLLTTLLEYCLQIVKAMAYLESKHCVHRDLAARNILITKDEKNVKICDFGLMRNLKENEEMYIMGPQKRVPFSWCPPESLKQRKFSHASDVWAFGVTVWELFSYGEDPWIGCRAIDVLKLLDKGERLKKPDYCSEQIYDIISLCWNVNPDARPKFTQLKGFLQQAQFNMAEVRELHRDSGEKVMNIEIGDKLIVTQNTGVVWQGQNIRTREFGTFLRSCVFVHGKGLGTTHAPTSSPKPVSSVAVSTPPTRPLPPVPAHEDPGGHSKISLPVRGSFIHAGHGDVGGKSWGDPAKIDAIYLKNPIVGPPVELGIPYIVGNSSLTSPVRTAPPPPPAGGNSKPTTLSVRTVTDPLHPDWGDFDAAQSPSFSPSEIRLGASTNPPPVPKAAPVPIFSNTSTSVSVRPDHHHNARDIWMSSTLSHASNASSFIIPTANGTTSINMPTLSVKKEQPPLISQQTAATSFSSTDLVARSIKSSSVVSSSSSALKTPLGNGTPRPLPQIQSIPRPGSESRRSENRTPPTINSNSFLNTIPPASSSLAYSNHVTTPIENSTIAGSKKSSIVPPQGLNKRILDELNMKIKPSNGSVNTLTPTFDPAQNFVRFTSTGITVSPSKDPFIVPQSSIQLLERERYNNILENRTKQQLQTNISITPQANSIPTPRPHSTTGVPINSSQVPCLTPTLLPIPSKPPTPTSNNLAPHAPPHIGRSESQNRNSHLQAFSVRNTANVHGSSAPNLSQTLPLNFSSVRTHSGSSSDTMSIKDINKSSVVRPPSNIVSQTVDTTTHCAHETKKPGSRISAIPFIPAHNTVPVSLPNPTPTKIQTAANITTVSSAPVSTGTSTLSTSGITMRPNKAQSAHAETVDDRRSRIDEEISNLLGAPSPLLLGDKATSKNTTTNSSTKTTFSELNMPKAASTSSLPRQPTPLSTSSPSSSQRVKPQTDPLPISLNNVLEPTRLPISSSSTPNPPVVDKTVEINSIMNAFNYSSQYPPFVPQLSMPAQIPLFALNNSQRPAHPPYPNIINQSMITSNMMNPNPMNYGCQPALTNTPYIPINNTPSSSMFTIGSSDDILDALDPYRRTPVASSSSVSSNDTSREGDISRASQMEILYKEASFVEPAKCDEMVNQCRGDIASALKELKMEFLMECAIAADKGRAFSALEQSGWDLNRAAELLTG